MRKFLSKSGYVVYEATASDTEKLGGKGICDLCGSYSPTGYIVPVLNRYYCSRCYKSWDENTKMYPEDLLIEKKRIAYYDSVFSCQ